MTDEVIRETVKDAERPGYPRPRRKNADRLLRHADTTHATGIHLCSRSAFADDQTF